MVGGKGVEHVYEIFCGAILGNYGNRLVSTEIILK